MGRDFLVADVLGHALHRRTGAQFRTVMARSKWLMGTIFDFDTPCMST